MRLVNKRTPPPLLTKYAQTAGASFDDMDKNVKDQLKDALLDEQGWVCGYCEQRITSARMKVEHFCEQSICNGENGGEDLRLIYGNLLAVCMGDAGLGRLHCDTSKATFNSGAGLPIEVSPWNSAHMAAISYGSTGKVSSSIPRHDTEINTILNLNVNLLKEQRRRIFNRVFEFSEHPTPAVKKDKMRRLLQTAIDRAGGEFPNDFPGLYEYMLNRFCG
jgi:uncharacterized protein (TIGR02646 family)